MKLRCKKCKNIWDYKGKKKPSDKYYVFVACSNCHGSVKLIPYKKG